MKALNELCQRGLDRFYANESWKSIYDAAPEGAKAALEIRFQNSLCAEEGNPLSPEDILNLSRHRNIDMKKKDWEYLLMFAKDPRQIAFYKRCIAESAE